MPEAHYCWLARAGIRSMAWQPPDPVPPFRSPPCPWSPRMKLCLQSRADLTALDCRGPQLLSDATLVSFQSLTPEGSDASFRCVPDPALAERHLAKARQARPLPWGADIPHSCHLPPKSLEVSENGKAGSQGEAQTPNNGRPRLGVRGRPSRESYTGRCQPEIILGP